jgi:hypothetical protein
MRGRVLGTFVMYALLTRTLDPFHLSLMAGTAVLLAAPIVLAGAGASMPGASWCSASARR